MRQPVSILATPLAAGQGMTLEAKAADAVSRASLSPALIVSSLAVGFVSALIRSPGAARDAFWQDEVASARVIGEHGPLGMIRQVGRGEATPPLWYGLGWSAHELGLSAAGFRWLSVLAGAVLAALVVVVARRVLPLWASVGAGLLVAFGRQFVLHGRELRAYELFALLSVLFVLALLSFAFEARTSRQTLKLAACVALGSLTNYFFLLILATGMLWLWLEPSLRDRRRALGEAVAIGLIPLAVWSPLMARQYLAQRFSWIGPFRLRLLLNAYWLLFAHHLPAQPLTRGLLPPLVLLAAAAGAVALARISASGRLMALMALVPLLLAALAWALGARVFDERNLIGGGPFVALALVALAVRLPHPLGAGLAAAAVLAVGAGAVAAESTAPAPYDRAAQQLLSQGWRPGDPIVLFGNFYAYGDPLDWYLPGRSRLTLGEPVANGLCSRIFVVAQRAGDRKRLQSSGVLASEQRVAELLVGRLAAGPVPGGSGWQRSHLLVSEATSASCAQPVSAGQVGARLEPGRDSRRGARTQIVQSGDHDARTAPPASR